MRQEVKKKKTKKKLLKKSFWECATRKLSRFFWLEKSFYSHKTVIVIIYPELFFLPFPKCFEFFFHSSLFLPVFFFLDKRKIDPSRNKRRKSQKCGWGETRLLLLRHLDAATSPHSSLDYIHKNFSPTDTQEMMLVYIQLILICCVTKITQFGGWTNSRVKKIICRRGSTWCARHF